MADDKTSLHMSYSDNPFIPQMLSPAAYEIGRHGRTPASHFYGLPNISIPLTEVRAKGCSLPVTLSYHAGGHKPDQHPGWVGLGWSLNAGGSIVRIVNGRKDEMSSMENAALTGRYETPGYLHHIAEVQTETNWNDSQTFWDKTFSEYLEYEPDEYVINAPGIHASFYITGPDKIAVVSRDESAIELESFEIGDDSGTPQLDMYPGKCTRPIKACRYKYLKKFIIKDKYGNRYIFGGNDDAIEYSVVQKADLIRTSTGVTNSNVWNAFATADAWMLTRIERADGEIITFEYERSGIPIVLRDIHHGESFASTDAPELSGQMDTYQDMTMGYKRNLNFHFLIPTYLKSIKCLLSGDELNFTCQNSQELQFAINEADFKLYVADLSSQESIVGPFSYSQFQAENIYRKLISITGNSRDIRFSYTDNSSTRLKLNKIELYKSNSQKEGEYSFSYNGTSLPAYNSRQTDIWGYYNGISYSDIIGSFGSGMNARRIAVKEKMLAEILTCITYPTGGRTEYSYESHKYSKKAFPFSFTPVDCESEGEAGGLRIKTITDYARNDGTPQTRTFEYSENGVSSGILCAEGACKVEGQQSFTNGIYNFTGAYALYSEIPILPLSDTDGRHVTYSFVREIFPDGSFIDHRFSNYDTSGCQDYVPAKEIGRVSGCPLYPKFTSRSLFRGLLNERTTYRSDGTTILRETFTYGDIGNPNRFKSVSRHSYLSERIVFAAYVSEHCGYPGMLSKTEARYLDDGTQITDTFEYSYKPERLLIRIRHRRGADSSERHVFYPSDRTGASYAMMSEAGMSGVPVGEAILRNEGVILGTETSFVDQEIDTDTTAKRKILVPQKMFSTRLGAPEPVSSYTASPSTYLSPEPDMHAKSWDAKGNVKFIGLRNGSALEHHWTQRTGNPGMRLRTADVPAAGHAVRAANVRLKFGSSEHLTASFKTTEQTNFSVTLGADYNYAWHICVLLDGTHHYLAKWAITDAPDASWENIVNTYGYILNITIPAGEHSLSIYHISWKGPGGSAESSGGSIQCTYAESVPFNDISTFIDLDADTETGDGFHCERGHVGPLTVSHPVVSGKTYILDYMLKSGSTWQYVKTSYTGGDKTIGASGQTISNVRIYPADSMPESFSWRKFTGLAAEISPHGVAQSYTYDEAGRLMEVRDNAGCKVMAHSYSFGNGADVRTEGFTSADGGSKRSVIKHYDGLGRLEQEIMTDASPSGSDIITYHEYDNMDREIRTWLPVPVSLAEDSIADISDIQSAANSFYGTSGATAHSLSIYEASPKDRLLRKYGPGKAWRDADKAVRMSLMSNGTTSSLPTYHRGFSISWSGTAMSLVRNSGPTAAGTLLIEQTMDEDGRARYDFRNMHGEIVLTRMTGDNGSWNDTHFIYDGFGRLAAVLPPKQTSLLESDAATAWTESSLSQLTYLYRYDNRGNCIAKHLPGGGWIYYIYDKGDRLVLSQDVIQRSQNQWTFRLEDLFGRECVIGTAVMTKDAFADPLGSSNVYVTMPSAPSYSDSLKGYEITGLSLGTDIGILKVNYYDGYGFLGNSPFPAASSADAAYDTSTDSEYGMRYTLSERGLMTGSLVRVLDSSGTEAFLWNVAYYDDKGRPVQTRESMHFGGVIKEYYAYDFTGNIIRHKTIQTPSSGTATTVVRTFTYDAMGRPLTKTLQVGGGAVKTVSARSYDNIGRLTTDTRNSLASLKESRSYNIRSWLTGISGQLFTESLKYEDSSSPQWGGNISSMEWGTSSVQKGYQLSYDSLSRLVSAAFHSGGVSQPSYSETYAYDNNGNMSSHTRAGQTQTLTLVGNRLANIAGQGFIYDNKGRVTSSAYNQNVMTEYNILDLPQKHTVGGGSAIVDYRYAADGRKLQEKVTAGSAVSQRDYVGEFIYENGTLKRILFEGGYVSINGTTATCMFFLRDHLGSVRVVVSETGAVAQTNEYYPFGDLFAVSSGDSTGNTFLFGGKELGTESGLYDFSARFLLSRFGRFTTLDPLAEKYPSVSPYAYCNCNPARYIDPDGRDWYEDDYGNAVWRNSNDSIFIDEDGAKWRNIGQEYLFFNGEKLYYYNQSYGLAFDAVSGRPNKKGDFIYSKERQALIGEGPIPEGLYDINPQEIQSYLKSNIVQKLLGLFGKGTFPNGPIAWGFERVWINPNNVQVYDPVNDNYITRGKFSIHGGLTPGSAGCIDLSGNAREFFENLKDSNSRYIRLNVNYGYKVSKNTED